MILLFLKKCNIIIFNKEKIKKEESGFSLPSPPMGVSIPLLIPKNEWDPWCGTLSPLLKCASKHWSGRNSYPSLPLQQVNAP